MDTCIREKQNRDYPKVVFLKIILSLILVTLAVLLPTVVLAQQTNPINEQNNSFITIVNPVRISTYNLDPKGSLLAEYSEVKKRDLPATWLLTYDVLNNRDLVGVLKQMDQKQELGIFLEVTPNFAQSSGVTYNKTDSWHRSNSLFLSGYTQEDRKKLIDRVFENFKEDFGYYPASIGAWWVDSYSLSYIKQRYGVTANLSVADQNSTDGYSIWGTYWSTPYYPSTIDAAFPANNFKKKLDLVTLQWAARDPLNSYGDGEASRFSTQDYQTIGLKDDYFEKLVNLYGRSNANKFGQITIGLEGDLSPGVYSQTFARQLDIVRNLNGFKITDMKDFSSWYKSNFPNLSPAQVITSDDLLGKKIKSVWYQSPFYRIGFQYDGSSNVFKVVDWRIYPFDFREPFFKEPNNQLNLYINTPALVDSVNNIGSYWQVNKQLVSVNGNSEKLELDFSDRSRIILTNSQLSFDGFSVPEWLNGSNLVAVKSKAAGFDVTLQSNFIYSSPGLTFRALKPQILYRISSSNLLKIKYIAGILGVLILALLSLYWLVKIKDKRVSWFVVLVLILVGVGIAYKESTIYYVSQDEISALLYLKSLPKGRVLVEDKSCINCTYHTSETPAVFVDKKDYVGQLSERSVIYNSSIFNAKTRSEGKEKLQSLGVKYIYLTKYGNYIESLPFSPGDYNVEKIYENGNAQIWEVK